MQALVRSRVVFSASADPNPTYGFAPAGGGAPATTGATITVTGGVGPFTHNGTFISGGTGIVISAPTTTSPLWQTANDSAQLRTGTYRHTVTDTGAGGATTSVDISVTLEVA